ncbi:MAG TPA: hypothetical protein VEI02_02060 [Planctomycetota bacterium]|nr:hypothetical protein [Planctomycetota bacterium]
MTRLPFVLAAIVAVVPAQRAADGLVPLSVLYAGAHDARADDFSQFLRTRFAKAGGIRLAELQASDAARYDVVVVDGAAVAASSRPAFLDPATWPTPTVVVGAPGGRVFAGRRLKLDMNGPPTAGAAHLIVPAHPVFAEPKTGAALDDVAPVPPKFRTWPEGAAAGETLRVWRAHADAPEDAALGATSEGFGFHDSPDCEVIARGLVDGAPNAVVVGRQGPFLHWGFGAPPSRLTPSGRAALLNAIAYVARFKGAPILVTDPVPSRDLALAFAARLRDPALRDDARRRFAPAIFEEVGGDPLLAADLIAGEVERLRCDRMTVVGADGAPCETFVFSIDEDARALGLSNRAPEAIDACLNLIGHREEVDRAHRLLLRSVGVDLGPDLRHWHAWWNARKLDARFCDTAGYHFLFPVADSRPAAPR